MSVVKVKNGYENVGAAGSHGKFATKEAAEKQKAAMFANGWRPEGHAEGGEVDGTHELHRKIIRACLDHEMAGAAHDVVHTILNHEENDSKSKDAENAGDKSAADGTVDEPTEVVRDNDAPNADAGVPQYVSPEDKEDEDDEDEDEDDEVKRMVDAYLRGH